MLGGQGWYKALAKERKQTIRAGKTNSDRLTSACPSKCRELLFKAMFRKEPPTRECDENEEPQRLQS